MKVEIDNLKSASSVMHMSPSHLYTHANIMLYCRAAQLMNSFNNLFVFALIIGTFRFKEEGLIENEIFP